MGRQETNNDKVAAMSLWKPIGIVALATVAAVIAAFVVKSFLGLGGPSIVPVVAAVAGVIVYQYLWVPSRRSRD
jgi:hypothetical protein